MEGAAIDVKGGKSIWSVVKDINIDRSSLQRYIKKTVVYSETAEANRVLTEEVDKKLADHVKKLADQFRGLLSNYHSCPQQLEREGLSR